MDASRSETYRMTYPIRSTGSRYAGRSVGAGLHRGPVEEFVVRVRLAARGDRIRATVRHLADQPGLCRRPDQLRVSGADHAQPGVLLELGARVGDVEVAHGELADPVQRAEG